MPRTTLICCAFLLLCHNHELGSKPLDVSKNTPAKGLKTYTPDYADLKNR